MFVNIGVAVGEKQVISLEPHSDTAIKSSQHWQKRSHAPYAHIQLWCWFSDQQSLAAPCSETENAKESLEHVRFDLTRGVKAGPSRLQSFTKVSRQANEILSCLTLFLRERMYHQKLSLQYDLEH